MKKYRNWLGIGLFASCVICLVGIVACTTGTSGGGGTVSNDNEGNNPETTFQTGAVEPPEEYVRSRPQAINPFGAANVDIPSSVNLIDKMPPIGDQGQMPSCTAWAAGYAAATYTANKSFDWGATTSAHQASPGYLYTRLVTEDADQGTQCGTGSLISTAMNLLVSEGCSSLAVLSYSDQQCLEPDAQDASNFKIGSFNRVDPSKRNAVKAELASGHVIVIGAQLDDDFFDYRSGVYQGSGTPMMQGETHAAHAMSCIGYDDAKSAYLIFNSWGTSWGEQGVMWMAYETFERMVFESYAILPPGDREPPVDPDDPDDNVTPTEQSAELTAAYQFADIDPDTQQQMVYLVFEFVFNPAVFINSFSVTDPNGNAASDNWGQEFADGYVYFAQTGGFQYPEGTYHIEFNVNQQDGQNNVIYSADPYIESIGGSDSNENQICYDFCWFAYDGECDDGGPGAVTDFCAYGTDCYDCGPREGENPYYYEPYDWDYNWDDYDWYDDDYYYNDDDNYYYNDDDYYYNDDDDYYDPYSYYDDDYYPYDYYYSQVAEETLKGGESYSKSSGVTFRGIPLHTPAWATDLPVRGIDENTLGADRRPATITQAENQE